MKYSKGDMRVNDPGHTGSRVCPRPYVKELPVYSFGELVRVIKTRFEGKRGPNRKMKRQQEAYARRVHIDEEFRDVQRKVRARKARARRARAR